MTMDNKTWIPGYDDPSSAQYQQGASDFSGDVSPTSFSVNIQQTTGLCRVVIADPIGLEVILKFLCSPQAQA